MRSLSKIFSVFLILLCSVQQLSAEVPELVQQAFQAMQAHKELDWAYTRTRTDKDVIVERYDPSAEQKWTTLSINGEPVSLDFKHPQHRDEKEEENESDAEKDSFSDIGLEDSWELVSETDTEVTYTFQPKAEDAEEAKFLKHLQGTMLIDKQNPHVKKFSMKALRKFKAMAMVKILNMQVEVEFADIGNDIYKVVKESEDVTVRVALIKKREKSESVYSDYVNVDLAN